MTPEEQLKEFVTLVSEMRDAQTKYFATRDPGILATAKTKERRVDQFIVENGRPVNSQRKLFEY